VGDRTVVSSWGGIVSVGAAMRGGVTTLEYYKLDSGEAPA
jgi:hypothetical protein